MCCQLDVMSNRSFTKCTHSEEGYGKKHQESIRESYYDRDSKDLHAGICTNPQKGAQCMNRMIDLSD